jgi:hypothetical protein
LGVKIVPNRKIQSLYVQEGLPVIKFQSLYVQEGMPVIKLQSLYVQEGVPIRCIQSQWGVLVGCIARGGNVVGLGLG